MLPALGLLFGFAFLLLTPPFQTPDEFNHFFRAYQISEGGLLAVRHGARVGGDLPCSLSLLARTVNPDLRYRIAHRQDLSRLRAAFSLPLRPTVRQFTEFPNTALYAPLPYLPQVAGLLLGRCLGLPPLWLLYLGRAGNLLCWLALVTVAVTLIPLGKWTLWALALSPMALSLAASLSPDATLIGAGFLLLALTLHAAVGDATQPLTGRQLTGLFLLAVSVTLAKQAYLPLVLLILLIPLARFGSPRRAAGFLLGVFFVTITLWGGWWLMTQPLFVPSQPLIAPPAQLRYLLGHPWHFGRILLATYGQPWRGELLLHEWVGVLGWLDTPLPSWCYPCYLWALLIVAVSESAQGHLLGNRQRWGLLLIGLFAFLSVNLLLYLSWDTVGYSIVSGLQGRYFIPVVPCLLLGLFIPLRWRIDESSWLLAGLRTLPFVFVLCVSLRTVLARYYG